MFKRTLGVTPGQYSESRRLHRLKGGLRNGHSVTRALYDAGYSMNNVNPDYVVIGESRGYGLEAIERAVSLVDRGARLVATNPDLSGPSESGLVPACGALVARALMERLGLSEEEWTAFSALITQRAHRFAAQNPDAHLNFEIPIDEYYRGIVTGKNYRYWWPLRYNDFCPMSDGVAAVILTARPQEVRVTGVGSATDIPTIPWADEPAMRAGKVAFDSPWILKSCWEHASIGVHEHSIINDAKRLEAALNARADGTDTAIATSVVITNAPRSSGTSMWNAQKPKT